MNVLVIGGAGFIGSHLVERLLADDHRVDVADDLSGGSLANLRDARAAGKQLRIDTVDAASADIDALITLREPEVIYLLALAAPGTDPPAATMIGSVITVAEAARRLPEAKLVVLAPAASLYGDVAARQQPIKEIPDGVPTRLAGVLWRSVIGLLDYYRAGHNVEYTALVASTIYGPRQRPNGGVVARFAAAAQGGEPATIHGDGRQTRDLLYIDDAVDALARAAVKAGGLTVNIGTGRGTAIKELWSMLSAAPARHGPQRPDEVARLALNTTRARIHLGWSAWTELVTGLQALSDAPR